MEEGRLVGIGVDVAAHQRLSRMTGCWPEQAHARLFGPEEWAWVSAAGPETATACFAAKEAMIKVLLGRPNGFSWQEIRVCGDSPSDEEVPAVVGDLAEGLRSLSGCLPDDVVVCRYELTGACRRRAEELARSDLWALWAGGPTTVTAIAAAVAPPARTASAPEATQRSRT